MPASKKAGKNEGEYQIARCRENRDNSLRFQAATLGSMDLQAVQRCPTIRGEPLGADNRATRKLRTGKEKEREKELP